MKGLYENVQNTYDNTNFSKSMFLNQFNEILINAEEILTTIRPYLLIIYY